MKETNILVVDDEKEIADLLEIYLISDGFQVKKAYSAAEGLKMLEEPRSRFHGGYLRGYRGLR